MKECTEFVEMLFHAGTNAHILHLKTKSYAQHKALGEFYEKIIELADNYAEACQGIYGIFTDYKGEYKLPSDDPVTEISNLGLKIREMRKKLPQDSELQNIVDEIAGFTGEVLYQLRFLK